MNAYQARIDWDEDGARLVLSTDEGTQTFKLDDPEQLYDAVKGGIGPWLRERDEAFAEFKQALTSGTGPAADYFACKDPEGDWVADQREAYDLSDPKHPDFHSVHADIIDFSFPEAPEVSW